MKRFFYFLNVLFLIGTVTALAWQLDLSVPVGETARSASLSPDGRIVYAGAIRDRKIIAIDTLNEDIIREVSLIDLNPNAWAKAVFSNKKGDVYVPGCDVLELYCFDSMLSFKGYLKLTGFGISDCEGLVADEAGNIFAGDREGDGGLYKLKNFDGILELDSQWGEHGWADVGQVRLPCMNDTSIFVVDYDTSILYEVSVKTGKRSKLAQLTALGGFATAVDDAGRVYVAHYNDSNVAVSIWENGKITEITRDELKITSNIGGIAVTKDGESMFIVEEETKDGGMIKGYLKSKGHYGGLAP